jgi:septum formation inhibitor-activating ATPase MinD
MMGAETDALFDVIEELEGKLEIRYEQLAARDARIAELGGLPSQAERDKQLIEKLDLVIRYLESINRNLDSIEFHSRTK